MMLTENEPTNQPLSEEDRRAYLARMQDYLTRLFPDLPLSPEEVQTVEMHAHVINFPRDMFCDCKRCTSPWQEKSVLGHTWTITTRSKESYTRYIPSDGKTLEHVWE